jgi:hypothetical protein
MSKFQIVKPLSTAMLSLLLLLGINAWGQSSRAIASKYFLL